MGSAIMSAHSEGERSAILRLIRRRSYIGRGIIEQEVDGDAATADEARANLVGGYGKDGIIGNRLQIRQQLGFHASALCATVASQPAVHPWLKL